MKERDQSARRTGRLTCLLGAGLLFLGACSGQTAVRGNMVDLEDVEEIKSGEFTRDDVAALLGSPSATSTFEDKRWYYIGQKTEQVAFMKPEVIDRRVLVVDFDGNGTVAETKLYGLEDGQVIDMVARTTPTEGRDLTLLQQLFGNLGRFPIQDR